jgi:transcriptional regulator with XRE-family HTH domain
MAKIIQQLSAHTTRELLTSELPRSAYPQTFGELMFIYRTSLGLSQRQVAQTAELSESYFSELENSKRVAPPYATALRIATALNLSANDESNFVGVAVSERAALLDDLHLPPQIRQLIALLRVAGPRLPTEVVNLMEAKLQEVYV